MIRFMLIGTFNINTVNQSINQSINQPINREKFVCPLSVCLSAVSVWQEMASFDCWQALVKVKGRDEQGRGAAKPPPQLLTLSPRVYPFHMNE